MQRRRFYITCSNSNSPHGGPWMSTVDDVTWLHDEAANCSNIDTARSYLAYAKQYIRRPAGEWHIVEEVTTWNIVE